MRNVHKYKLRKNVDKVETFKTLKVNYCSQYRQGYEFVHFS